MRCEGRRDDVWRCEGRRDDVLLHSTQQDAYLIPSSDAECPPGGVSPPPALTSVPLPLSSAVAFVVQQLLQVLVFPGLQHHQCEARCGVWCVRSMCVGGVCVGCVWDVVWGMCGGITVVMLMTAHRVQDSVTTSFVMGCTTDEVTN